MTTKAAKPVPATTCGYFTCGSAAADLVLATYLSEILAFAPVLSLIDYNHMLFIPLQPLYLRFFPVLAI